MAKPEKDASVFAHIEHLVGEEHRLFESGELSPEESKRLAQVQAELDSAGISCASAARCGSSAAIRRRRMRAMRTW